MGILHVGLFGNVRVTHSEWLTELQLTRENQGLLAYLLLQRHRLHSREILADLFWGEQNPRKARGSLNTALWKLKKVLEPEGILAGTYLKTPPLGGVGFNRESHYWLDVEVFEEEINRILFRPVQTAEETCLVDLKKILDLYKGDLLEGFYSDWALRERERLRALYVKSLIYLLHYHGIHGDYEKALTYGHQILDLEPLREEIHREIMKLYAENGQRALAARQYEICRSTLARELRISPMEDTEALYTQICAGVQRSGLPTNSKNEESLDKALRQLRDASQAIDLVKEQIHQALQLIEKKR
jgi:DNA-binding SARP family transcriptional activator